MRKIVKKIIVMALVFIFVFTAAPANHVEAAKKPQLKTTKVTLKVGQKKQLKVINTKNKIKWSSSKKSVAGVSKKGKVTAKKAGKATIYGLRHMFATILVKQGVPLAKISGLLGHSSVNTTFEYYCDVMDEKEKIIAFMNDAFIPEGREGTG